jgi:hypothetical protein
MKIEDALARIDVTQMSGADMVALAQALTSLAIHRNPELWLRVAGDCEDIDMATVAAFMRSLPEDFGKVPING